jgi:hypothetical protein
MAIPSYDQSLDTMVSTAIDTYSRDPINALTDSGEKFLKAAAQKGRVFIVNDAENVRHPVLYDHGENSSLYRPDTVSGTPQVNNLSDTATEILTHTIFTLQAATRNINFPQSQPPGNVIDYVSNVVKANMMHILNEEEILFIRGVGGASVAGNPTLRGAMANDTGYAEGYPASLAAFMYGSSSPAPIADGDLTDESFGNLKTDDVARWQPYHVASTGTDHSGLIEDLQKAILYASYSETERPTDVMVTLDTFEKMLDLLRDKAALPDPVRADLGKEGTIPFGGITMDWSRYFEKSTSWDVSDPELGTPSYPIFGLNWNSLRLNTVRAGGVSGDSVGFIRQIGDMQPHPLKSNLFKRIEWKRQWSVDNGRRSFFTIYGNISVA